MPTYAEPSDDDSECPSILNHLMTTLNPPLDAELSGMKDDGKSQDNGSAAILVLFRTTRSSQRKFPKKLKRKEKENPNV